MYVHKRFYVSTLNLYNSIICILNHRYPITIHVCSCPKLRVHVNTGSGTSFSRSMLNQLHGVKHIWEVKDIMALIMALMASTFLDGLVPSHRYLWWRRGLELLCVLLNFLLCAFMVAAL